MIFRMSARAAVLGLATFGFGAAAAADQLADIKAAGKIVTATDMHYAPFDMLTNGTYEGITKDLFDQVSKDIGVEPLYQDIPWTAELPGLEVGKFDIVIAPVTVTAERQQRYTFTLPIADATVSLVRSANSDAIKKPADIAGKTVGVQQGTAQAKQLQDYAATLEGGVTIREYGTKDEAYADLATGRLDAVAASLPNLNYLAAARPETFALTEPAQFGPPTYFSWVLRKEAASESFAAAIDASLLKMMEDGRMEAIHTKWLGSYVDLPRELPAN